MVKKSCGLITGLDPERHCENPATHVVEDPANGPNGWARRAESNLPEVRCRDHAEEIADATRKGCWRDAIVVEVIER